MHPRVGGMRCSDGSVLRGCERSHVLGTLLYLLCTLTGSNMSFLRASHSHYRSDCDGVHHAQIVSYLYLTFRDPHTSNLPTMGTLNAATYAALQDPAITLAFQPPFLRPQTRALRILRGVACPPWTGRLFITNPPVDISSRVQGLSLLRHGVGGLGSSLHVDYGSWESEREWVCAVVPDRQARSGGQRGERCVWCVARPTQVRFCRTESAGRGQDRTRKLEPILFVPVGWERALLFLR
jgi:hypothetical protein